MADNIESAKIQRTSAKSRFTRKLKEFLKAVDEDKGLEIVNRTFEELNEAWGIEESKHDTYVEFMKEEEQLILGSEHYNRILEVRWKGKLNTNKLKQPSTSK